MPNCKSCSKQFHVCSNCGLFYSWEYDYCSEECYEKSSEYIDLFKNFQNIISKLSKEEFEFLKYHLDSEVNHVLNKFEKESENELHDSSDIKT